MSPPLLAALAAAALTLLAQRPFAASVDDCMGQPTPAARLACRVAARTALMEAVAASKAAGSLPIYDAQREAAVLERVGRTAAPADLHAALLFTQVQMDLAKQVQDAWMRTENGRRKDAQEQPSLDRLRDTLDAMAQAISADLADLRHSGGCRLDAVREAFEQALLSMPAALDDALARRYAGMLAAAACAPHDGGP